jgi:hypothetical protein
MASKTIESNQFQLNLLGQTTPLYFKTKTTFTPDVNGNPIQGTSKTELLYTPNGSQFFTSATSTEGGKAGSWELKKYTPAEILNTGIAQFAQPDGTILGPTTVNSLQTPNGVLNQITQNSIIQAADKENIKGGYQKPLADKLKNTAPDPGPSGPDAVNLGNIDTTNFQIKSIDAAVKKHGNYQYPLDMPNDMDKITFTMIEYRGSRLKSNQLGFKKRFEEKDETTGKTKDIKNRLGTVTMGIQPRISDRNSVGWTDTDANTLGLLAGGTSLQLMEQGGAGITEILNKIGNTFEAEKGNIGTALKLKLAGEAASISGLTSRIGGAIFNPNLELLFDNPQLRPFDFTFQLTPRDLDEAKAVKQIIRFFKQGMAVQRTAAELFLKAPNVFDINYMFGQKEDHPGLNKIKTCALQSFNVDYTPTGSYMTFSDGTMTAYSITLSFKELEPVYSDEYDVDKQANETVDSVRIGF